MQLIKNRFEEADEGEEAAEIGEFPSGNYAITVRVKDPSELFAVAKGHVPAVTAKD